VYYYALYTVKQRMARYCGYLEVALLEEVEDLEAFNQDGNIDLTWDWPADIDYVKVVRTPVDTDGDPEKCRFYTRERYYKNGSRMIDEVGPNRCKYRYQIHTARYYRGKPVTSLTGACIEVIGGHLPKITYKLYWKPKKNSVVEVECDISKVDCQFSGLVLRKKKSERPKDAWDGEEVDRWKSDTQNQSTKVVLRDSNPEFGENTYYRVFLADPKDAEIIKVGASPTNILRV